MTTKRTGLSTLSDRLQALDRNRSLRFLGTNRRDGELAVTVAGRPREYPGPKMLDWLDGFTAGLAGYPQLTSRLDRAATIGSVRRILVNPSVTDQARIRVRLAMQQEQVGVVQLAARITVTKKAIAEALRLGGPGTIGMMAGLGRDPAIRPDLAAADPNAPLTAAPPAGWEEPNILTRLRLLGYAHEQGVIHWVDPTEVNRAWHARTYTVTVGHTSTQLRADTVREWLTGAADALAPDVADQMYALPSTTPEAP